MQGSALKQLIHANLGRAKYEPTWNIQKKLVDLRYLFKIPDCLLVCEHYPVITMGRGTEKGNLLVSEESLREKGIELFEIERGGDITFHGPGQAVIYPIINLKDRNGDVHKYLRDLERVAVQTLEDIGLKAGIKEGLTGIWVDDHKVGAIGIAVSRWITYHGLALNVSTDPDYFELINPCGITEFPVGSITELSGQELSADFVGNLLVENFVDEFGYNNIERVENLSDYIKKHSDSTQFD